MAKKLPLVPIGIAAGAGIATYFAATQLAQRVAFMQQHPVAAPLTLAAVGVLVAKKHLPIGLGIAGAAGAIGYLQYKAGATTQPQAQTQTQTQTTPANYQPATTQPSTTPGTTPGTTDQSGGGVGQTVQNLIDQAGQGSGDQSGTTPSAGDGTTGTAGYSAGKLLSGPHMHSHLKHWRGGAGALMSGPRPASHLAPWHRNAGHYDAPAPGEAGGLRGGAFGLSSD